MNGDDMMRMRSDERREDRKEEKRHDEWKDNPPARLKRKSA